MKVVIAIDSFKGSLTSLGGREQRRGRSPAGFS